MFRAHRWYSANIAKIILLRITSDKPTQRFDVHFKKKQKPCTVGNTKPTSPRPIILGDCTLTTHIQYIMCEAQPYVYHIAGKHILSPNNSRSSALLGPLKNITTLGERYGLFLQETSETRPNPRTRSVCPIKIMRNIRISNALRNSLNNTNIHTKNDVHPCSITDNYAEKRAS